jgi:hypothetical protein
MYPSVSLLLLLSPLLLFVVLLGQLVSAIPIDSSASLPSCEPGLRAGTVTSQLRLPVSMAVAGIPSSLQFCAGLARPSIRSALALQLTHSLPPFLPWFCHDSPLPTTLPKTFPLRTCALDPLDLAHQLSRLDAHDARRPCILWPRLPQGDDAGGADRD